jgi:TatD DNase family protein
VTAADQAPSQPDDQLNGAPLVDAHAHTWSREFADDYDATIERAWEAGLSAVVEVGTDSETSLRALALARADRRVHAVGGLHPHEAKRLPQERNALRALFDGNDFVAVGEIGLDFYRNLSPPEQQYEALRWQLELARETELPIVIHSRDADEECFEVVAEWAKRTGRYLGRDREIGMMHCFAGNAALAERYRELGLLISIPGTVTYANNTRGREVARALPLNAMLVETDCPYLTPQPHRGTRNESAYVLWTAQEVAALRGCAVEDVATATAENAARLFGFAL